MIMEFGYSVSIVTPTYNRKYSVCDLVDSSLFLINDGFVSELIVVDDCSSDGTLEILEKKYCDEIASGVLKVHRLIENVGVTGARNAGISLAHGDWVVLIDSDDTFAPNAGKEMLEKIRKYSQYDIIFFRCCDKSGRLIGSASVDREIGIKEFYNNGTPGECMPVIKRSVLLKYPYFQELRGGESVAFMRMLHNGCNALLVDAVTRVYNTAGQDRLCENNRKRAYSLFLFYAEKYRYIKYSNWKNFVEMLVKLSAYGLVCVFDDLRASLKKSL